MGIENNFQVIIILIVFALTGSVSVFSGPLAEYLKPDSLNVLIYCLTFLILFPIYQVLLVWFGFVFSVIISVATSKYNFIFNFS